MIQYQVLESAAVGFSMVHVEFSQIAHLCYFGLIFLLTILSIGRLLHAGALYHILVWEGCYNGKFVANDKEKWDRAKKEILDRYLQVLMVFAGVIGMISLFATINTAMFDVLVTNLLPQVPAI